MVDEAMAVGRDGTVPERAVTEVRLALEGRSLEPRVTLDEGALAAGVEEALGWLDREPVDATVVKGAKRIYTTPARDGRTFDAGIRCRLADVRRLTRREVVVGRGDRLLLFRSDAETLPSRRSEAHGRGRGRDLATGRDHQGIWSDLGNFTRPTGPSRRWSTYRIEGAGQGRQGHEARPVSASFLGGKGGRIVGVAPAKNGRASTGATAVANARVTGVEWIELAPSGGRGPGRAQGDHRGGGAVRPRDDPPGVVEDVVPGERAELLRRQHLAARQDH
jgi:hypothetical protein